MKEEAEPTVETAKGILQDLVIVVSLVRTLTESFGSASDLYRKLKTKKTTSYGGDEEEANRDWRRRRPLRKRRDSSSESDHGRSHRRHIRWNLDSKQDEYDDSDGELIRASSSQVLAEYDRGYRKLGEGFARGDVVTQNQLQAQIIQLQRTLLSIQQDYMMSSYLSPSSSHSHVVRLVQTTRSARIASIQALHMQYQRMLESTSPNIPEPHQRIPGAFPPPAEHKPRHDSMCDNPVKPPEAITIQPYPKTPSKPNPPRESYNNKLFCVYARDLQRLAYLPLTDNYKHGGDNMCPYCHAHTSVRPGKAWEILADSCKKDGYKRHRLLIKNRFVVKCHREGAGFACVLCARFKESDTVCRRVEALIEHLWKDHTREELEKDDDVFEIDE